MKISHQLLNGEKNLFKPSWEIKHLFIGTFNPEGGQPVNYYYGRESNYFWKVISKIFNDSFDPYSCNNLSLFFDKLIKHGIGCVDMIKSVEFDETKVKENDINGNGYNDSKIINNKVLREYSTGEILSIIKQNPNVKIYTTWGKGQKLREWTDEIDKLSHDIINLKSPSRAARVPMGCAKFDYILEDWSNKIDI